MATESRRERRATFRQPCHQGCPVEFSGVLRDLSLGGAALELPFCVPVGQRLHIVVSDQESRIGLTCEVVATAQGYVHPFVMHMRFVDVSAATERALQRHLIKLQVQTSVSLRSV